MTTLLQTLVSALSLGSVYALIALGYTLVYGVLRFINFAHSDVFTLGAWSAVSVAGAIGWSVTGGGHFALPVVLAASMAICAVVGVTIEALAYRPLRRAPRLNVLITAIGVSLLMQNVGQLRWAFGPTPTASPRLMTDHTVTTLAGVRIGTVDVAIVELAVMLMLCLEVLVYRTRLGRAMRAVSFDERTASLMGINVNRVVSITFAIGSALAAAAGVIYTMKYPTVGQPADATWILLGLKAFIAAVVGGIGNVRGAVAGAMMIAGLEKFGAAYVSSRMENVYVFAVLILVLLLRPSGLFGRAVVEKV
ncbi:MAG: branched-chain amino acid ABC transporter permease [Kofleriaceae bacterium]